MASLVSFMNILTSSCRLSPGEHYVSPELTSRTFDFVVVGAGAAGSVVARRLADANKEWNVALLESGGLPTYESEVGGYFINLLGTEIDWNDTTEPHTGYCRGFEGGRCRWPSGRVLGGSTTTNCMVYTHAIRQDFDDWETWGHTEWSYEGVKEYLTKSQHAMNPPAGSTNHGLTGPLKTSIIDSGLTDITDLLISAGTETGHAFKSDESVLGMFKSQNTIYDGIRQTAARAFLEDAPENLHIFHGAHVTKVNVDGGKATGVEVLYKKNIITVNANREVILSAGALRTPQILMLSGIGPADHLASKDIECINDLPVGNGLMDHFMDMGTFVAVDTNQKTTTYRDALEQFCAIPRSGPLTTTNVLNIFWFLSSKKEDRPDVQIHHLYYPKNDEGALNSFLQKAGMNQDSINAILAANKKHDLIQYMSTHATPKSRGTIRLSSANPEERVLINPAYFSDESGDDMAAMVAGAVAIEAAINSPSMQSKNATLVDNEVAECKNLSGVERWKCHFRTLGASAYHYCGTAAMGSVVEQNLKVKNMDNLRIIDASIVPEITDRNLMSVTYMIGEKGADYVLADN